MKLKYKYFVIDFDGTIAYDSYPNIGELIPGAKETILKIKELGGEIAIWTCRSGESAINAKNFLIENNIPFDYFNKPFKHYMDLYGEGKDNTRKIYGDIYIDDKSLHFGGKAVDWEYVIDNIFIHEEWKAGDRIEAIEDCWGNFKKNDQLIIHEINKENDTISFGPVGDAQLYIAQKYFRKVK